VSGLVATPVRYAKLFAAWLTYDLLQFILEQRQHRSEPWWELAILFTTLAVVWTIMTPIIIGTLKRVRDSASSLPALIVAHGALYLLLVAADTLTRRLVVFAVTGTNAFPLSATLLFFADMTAVGYAAMVIFADMVEANEAAARQARYELALKGELTKAKLTFLQGQLHPHFLFNALSTLAELIATTPERAGHIIRELAALFRYSVAARGDEVPLKEEMEAIVSYLAIQNVRFSDWISVECKADPEALGCFVPPLLLQPLVENAIRHGLQNRNAPGVIAIDAKVVGGLLHLTVADNGAGLNGDSDLPGFGIGLSNVRARLETHYGRNAALALSEGAGKGAVAEIVLPAVFAREERDGEIVPLSSRQHVTVGAWVRDHPVLSLIAGCFIAVVVSVTHDYAYLLLRGRSTAGVMQKMILETILMSVLWTLIVPAALRIADRLRTLSWRWLTYIGHGVAALSLSLLHAVIWRGIVTGSPVPDAGAVELSTVYGVLVYTGAVMFAERGRIEDWIRERQIASEKLVAAIGEEKMRAARLTLNPDDLAEELEALELTVAESPERAEAEVTDLASRLRSVLSRMHVDVPSSEQDFVFAGSGAAGTEWRS
jgi:hypothetical protein